MSRTPWFSINARAGGSADISIVSEIGEGGLTTADFQKQLKTLDHPSRINLLLSSAGGDLPTAMSIYGFLSRHSARKVVTVLGLAGSAATLVAMAGDEIQMDENAFLAFQRPFGAAVGEHAAIRSYGEALDKIERQVTDIYAQRSKVSRERISEMMATETWLTATEAVKMGFADRVTAAQKMAAQFTPHDLRRFAHVPARAAAMLTGGATRPKPAPLAATYERAYPTPVKLVTTPKSFDEIQNRAFEKFNASKRSDDDGDSRP